MHDAILICAPLDRIEADVAATQAAMGEAARTILGGFDLRSDASIIRYPNRYMDPRGAVMWDRVIGLIGDQQQMKETAA